jgi:hypothetical protein
MKTLLCTFALATLLFCSLRLRGQDDIQLDAKAPTLQVGLDGFTFSKGSLDAALIMEIIAEKQQELKLKTIQNVFLSRVENSGATVYTFVDNVVRELVFESDQNLRTKGILENAVNMAFVGAFLNYYLASMESNPLENQRLQTLSKMYDEDILKADWDKTFTSVKEAIVTNQEEQDFGGADRYRYIDNSTRTEFVGVLLDMCSYAIREDKTLKRLGLLQTGYSETYEYLNLYLEKKDDSDYKAVYKDIQKILTLCTDAIGTLHYIASQSQFKFNTTNSFPLAKDSTENAVADSITRNSLKKLRLEKLIPLIKELEKLSSASIATKWQSKNALLGEDMVQHELDVLVNLNVFLEKAENAFQDSLGNKIKDDVLYTLNHDYIPLLKQQPLLRSNIIDIISDLNQLNKQIFDKIAPNIMFSDSSGQLDQFIQLTSKLYELDKASTLTDYLRLLPEVSTFFPDSKVKSALSLVFRFVKDYTVVETNGNNEEVLTFNAESFIYKLQSLKTDKVSRIGFHFTVGLNTATFARPQSIAEAAPTRNFSFVGEKIGLKWKLYDYAFSKGRNPGETYKTSKWPGVNTAEYTRLAAPKEPLISNWHIVAYGSGLLYNLVDAKTEQEFNMPVIGVGTGLTFFNGLDVNISCGVPIYNDRPITTADRFYSLGFDIQFIEYYERLAQKRKNAQTQKRLAEAASEQ